MAIDLAPELYSQIQTIFNKKYKDAKAFGEPLDVIRQKINKGTATIIDADQYAVQVGNLMSESLKEVLVGDVLPDRKLIYELAQDTFGKSLEDAHYIISDITREIQEEMFEAQGIGLKPIQPAVNTNRIDGLMKIASEADDFDTIAQTILDEPVKNFALNVVDESVKRNAEFQQEAGLTVEVVRVYDDVGLHYRTQPCKWCLAREGTWEYEDALKNGVFQRHEGCHCTITYRSRKGDKSRSTGKWSGFSRI